MNFPAVVIFLLKMFLGMCFSCFSGVLGCFLGGGWLFAGEITSFLGMMPC